MKREGGYTVLETGLAIAMSATLVLLTFGLAAMVGRGRFRDSLVTTQSFIKQQYNEVRSGINSRLTEGSGTNADNQAIGSACSNKFIPGNNNGCYIIGRLLTFDNDGDNGRIQVSFIIAVVGANSKWPDSTKPGLYNLNNGVTLYALTDTSGNDAGLNPTIKQMGGNSLEKVWLLQNGGLETLYSAHPSLGSNLKNNMAILRSPVDGSLVVASKVGLKDVSASLGISGLMELDLKNAVTDMSQDDKLALAIRNSGLGYPGGVICIPGGDNPAGTSNNFNVAGGNWNWDGGLSNVGFKKDVVDACKNMDQ